MRYVLTIWIFLSAFANTQARFVGSEINYEKHLNGTTEITYRFFKSCDDTTGNVVDFQSFVFAKNNFTRKINLKPQFVEVKRMRNELNLDSSICSGNPNARYTDYREIIYHVILDTGSLLLYAVKGDCEWVVEIIAGSRAQSATLKSGYDHYNYCAFNWCAVGKNKSPEFVFNVFDVPCWVNSSVYLPVTAVDSRNKIRYRLGRALHTYDSSCEYRIPYTHLRPVKLYDPFKNNTNYCEANPPIGLCLDQSGYICYQNTGCIYNPTFVIEAEELVINCDGSTTSIGIIRRDFTLHYSNSVDTIIHSDSNSSPKVISYKNRTGYVGDTLNLIVEFDDKDYVADTSGNFYKRDSVFVYFKDTINGARYRVHSTQQSGFTFEWVPTMSDTSKNPYNIIFKIRDNYHPLNKEVYYQFPVYVIPKPVVDFEINPLVCGQFEIINRIDPDAECYTSRDTRVIKLNSNSTVKDAIFTSTNTFRTSEEKDTLTIFKSGSYLIWNRYYLTNGHIIEHRDTLHNINVTSVEMIMGNSNAYCQFEPKDFGYIANTSFPPLIYEWAFKEEGIVYNDSIVQFGANQFGKYDHLNILMTITDSIGCSASDSIEYTGFWLLDTLDLGKDLSFCKDSVNTILKAQEFESYLWDSGDTSSLIYVDSPGIYSIIVTDLFDCKQYDTIKIMESGVPPLPKITVYNEFLSADKYGIYSWFFENEILRNGAYREIKMTNKGTYKVVYYDQNGCPSDTGFFYYTPVFVQNPDQGKTTIHVYPNPVTNKELNFTFTESGYYQVRLYDILGKLVYEDKDYAIKTVVVSKHLSDLTGNYILEVEFNGTILYSLIRIL